MLGDPKSIKNILICGLKRIFDNNSDLLIYQERYKAILGGGASVNQYSNPLPLSWGSKINKKNNSDLWTKWICEDNSDLLIYQERYKANLGKSSCQSIF